MANDSMKNLFSDIKPVHDDFVLDERLIWIEINESLACTGRLCISTSVMSLINDSIPMEINGIKYIVQVHELAAWSPTFCRNFNDSDYDQEDPFFSNSDGDFVHEDPLLGYKPSAQAEQIVDSDSDPLLLNKIVEETAKETPKAKSLENVETIGTQKQAEFSSHSPLSRPRASVIPS
ncbi:hypothetical protein L1987_14923 [Smallanthus sonchifolius]|uniref:Uncharacterized protein n=1 Tax=Smallanthus sonchifolius TaxID=185202 RepID=A0ACB9J6B2_9ASTR|nr:hypothetical protein L1987_14923 [Smallanthus sonchifolius]